jgi:hypothetical protein
MKDEWEATLSHDHLFYTSHVAFGRDMAGMKEMTVFDNNNNLI